MPGPARTPTPILEARGSTLARERVATEPVEAVAAPEMPKAVSSDPDARAHWQEIVPRLIGRRTLTPSDLGLLAAMCLEWADYVRAVAACERLRKSRKAYKGHLIDHPRVVRKGAFERYSKAAIQFGLSPVAKSRVQATPPEKAERPRATEPVLRMAQ